MLQANATQQFSLPRRGWLLILGLVPSTIVNLVLTYIGVLAAKMSPVMYYSGDADRIVAWSLFIVFLLFPIISLVGAVLPWALLWFRPRAAFVLSAIPTAFLIPAAIILIF
jgi:hypothetical protein